MGVDTKGLLRGRVLPEDVLNYIRQTFDPNAILDVKLNNYGDDSGYEWIRERYDDSGEWKTWSGFIHFHDGVKDRECFIIIQTIIHGKTLSIIRALIWKIWLKLKLHIYHSIKMIARLMILKKIVEHFGGWVDEDDCDDEPYYPLLKNKDGTIKPAIHVTMNDIYEKFGATVIIDK